ncbi:DUF2937 family protein [Pseudaestuariivita rosea]|uniref:DUF2937 family protein n=1 Tax=Pseudaestuariivita rosea TaxID=2763263 RepID=UPI001ABA77BA|nr:DUF2937 family protein [Pseudaestuariivita rosea]
MRTIVFAVGLMGAVAGSQYPAYSQQYLQRLAGAVDELNTLVLAFDTSAAEAGLTREQAVAELSGTNFLEQRQGDVQQMFVRYERLNADLMALRQGGPLDRLSNIWRLRDADIARAAWDDYQPGVQLTFDGLIIALIGFLTFSIGFSGLLRLPRLMFRRRRSI